MQTFGVVAADVGPRSTAFQPCRQAGCLGQAAFPRVEKLTGVALTRPLLWGDSTAADAPGAHGTETLPSVS